jgi:DNA-binding PadR family transcriptional regulator
VLSGTQRLGPQAFGAKIHRDIEERTRRRVSINSIYGTLARLESRGLLRVREVATQSGAPGRPRRLVELTAAGWRALRSARLDLARMLGLVREVISNANPAN